MEAAGQVSTSGVAVTALVIAGVWLMLTVAGAAGAVLFQRLRIMWGTGHGWTDAGVLMRNRNRRALHARIERDRPILRAPQVPVLAPGETVRLPMVAPGQAGHAATQTMATIKMSAVDGDGAGPV
jgi:hypothetical protein